MPSGRQGAFRHSEKGFEEKKKGKAAGFWRPSLSIRFDLSFAMSFGLQPLQKFFPAIWQSQFLQSQHQSFHRMPGAVYSPCSFQFCDGDKGLSLVVRHGFQRDGSLLSAPDPVQFMDECRMKQMGRTAVQIGLTAVCMKQIGGRVDGIHTNE
jgi:hypothetical protein